MKLKKIISLLLCAVLALSMTACKFSTPAAVMTVDGEEIPAGLYLMYQYQAYTSAKNKLNDREAKVLKSEIEGVPAEEWIHSTALESIRRNVWTEKTFAEKGLSFTEEEQAVIDAKVKSNWAGSGALLAANGIGEESYRRFYECASKYEKLLTEYKDDAADKVTDAAAKKYMDETYSRVHLLLFPITDPDANPLPEEKLNELNELGARLAEELNAGGSMEELGAGVLEEAFAICGREYSEDKLPSYLSKNFVTEETTAYPEEIVQAIVNGEIGDADSFAGSYNVPMIYQKIANYEDNDDFTENFKETIVNEMNSAEFLEKVKQESAEYSVVEDAAAVKTYSPAKIKESI